MKMVKSLLLGSAAGLVAIAGAQAADLPVKAKPVEYVKVCSAYGAGYYYIPGTDICLRVGGYVFIEAGWNARGAIPYITAGTLGNDVLLNQDDNRINWRTQMGFIMDARQQTAIGTVRTYLQVGGAYNNPLNGATASPADATVNFERAFMQFAGFTAGFANSYFDFGGFYSIYALASIAWHWTNLFAYTANFGNGFSATLSLEDAQRIRTKISVAGAPIFSTAVGTTTNLYGGQVAPDIVANLRVDQAWGSAQIAGALHLLRTNQNPTAFNGNVIGPVSDVWGWAILGGIEIKTPMVSPGDSIMLQGVYTKGAVEYTGLGSSPGGGPNAMGIRTGTLPATATGPGTDIWDASIACGTYAAGDPTCSLVLSTAWSANLMFRHFWQPNLRSAFWVGYNKYLPGDPGLAATAPNMNITQAGGNIIWSPNPTLDLALDVIWSRVETYANPPACAVGPVSPCSASADIWSIWTRWRRNF